MKHTIYLNKRRLKSSKNNSTKDPCITVRNYKGLSSAHEVVIMGQDGKEAARVICRPDAPHHGNELWIETNQSIYMIFQVSTESEDEEAPEI